MTANSPDRVERVIGNDPTWSVIWLHGLGADGHDFEPLVGELGLSGDPGVRFVFPHAPYRAVTVNGGMRMRAWYDILSMDIARVPDADGVEESCDRLAALVAEEEARGIPAERILLAGFSQGGAIALHTALTRALPVAGVVALSTYLPLPSAAVDGPRPPVFMGHGSFDPVVPPSLGEAARERMVEAGFEVAWHTYAMPHAVSPEEIADLQTWFAARLAA